MDLKNKLSAIADKLNKKGLSKDTDIINDLLESLSHQTPVDRVMKLWEQRVERASNSSDYPHNVLELLNTTIAELDCDIEESSRQKVISRYYNDFSEEDIQEYINKLKLLKEELA